jgi:hypothetical protein
MTSAIGFCCGATVPSNGSAQFMGHPSHFEAIGREWADGGIALPRDLFRGTTIEANADNETAL